MERRRINRYALWFPVTLESSGTEAWAVCRDAGAGGVLISSTGRLEIGAEVVVAFRVTPDDPAERRIAGRVVRADQPDEDARTLFPFRFAIEFVEKIPELEERFRHASEQPPPLSSR